MMLILIGIVPAKFALDDRIPKEKLTAAIIAVEESYRAALADPAAAPFHAALDAAKEPLADLAAIEKNGSESSNAVKSPAFEIRKSILLIRNQTKHLSEFGDVEKTASVKAFYKNCEALKKHTDYSPTWVIVLIALSLGVGTMIGWKRIVVTIGEKIGKTHLTYAQGASAEIVAASTIAASTYLGLPVSTTHVLSSGIAGSMFASGGVKNLERSMITKIVMAWVLTFPVCVTMSGTLFLLFRYLFG